MRELAPFVVEGCAGGEGGGGGCGCAGDALVLAVADALGGRGPAGRPLPDHAQPSARHDALTTLLAEDVRTQTSHSDILLGKVRLQLVLCFVLVH